MEEFLDRLLDQLQEQNSNAKAKVQKLKMEIKESESEEKFWADLILFLRKKWFLHLLSYIDKETNRLKKMRAENHPLIPAIEDIYKTSKIEAEHIIRRYPALLEDACQKANLDLDKKSPHPKYKFDDGFFRLEIDEKKRMAILSNNEGRLTEFPADVDAVIEAVTKEHDRIFNRPFDGVTFLKSLRDQYEIILREGNLKDGASVSIREITKRLAKINKSFRTDEFLLDLSKLAENGPYEINNFSLDLQQTKDTNEGILLHGASARGYVGFILFKENIK